MSIYGALFAGVAGLNAQSNELGVIADNIANVNTVGYKQSQATFSTLVVGSGNAGTYSPGGVQASSSKQVNTQGLLTTTSSPTDIAISGSGFFVVNQTADRTGSVQYTRAGSFTQDQSGDFVNTAGLFLQAWPLDENGNLPGTPGNADTESSANLSSLRTVNVENITGTASPTTTVAIGANLNAGQSTLLGAGNKATPDTLDPANANVTASDILVPSPVNSLTRGDQFSVTTGAGQHYTYTYGGFTQGRSVTSGAGGDNALPLIAAPSVTPISVAAGGFSTGAIGANTDIIVTVPSTAALRTGYTVNISGESGGFDNVTAGDINGDRIITVIDSTHFSFASTVTAAGAGVTGGGAATVTASPFALNNAPITPTAVASHAVSSAQIDVTVASTADLRSGDTVTMSGVAAFDAFGSGDVNGAFKIVVDSATQFHYTASGNTAGAIVSSGAPGTATPDPIATDSTGLGTTLTISQPGNGLAIGDVVTLSGITSAINGIGTTFLNTSFIVTNIIDPDHFTVTAGAAANATGGGGAGSIESTTRPFQGNILDAGNATQTFLGLTGTAQFAPSALSFTINTQASGTVTFTYTTTTPNPLLGQFNNLTNLATAINSVTGLQARVATVGSNTQLYVGATDPNNAVSFGNGHAAGSGLPGNVLGGIDWVRELGLNTVNAATGSTVRYDTLNSLASKVDSSAGLNATINNPTSASSININLTDPLDTIQFSDADYASVNTSGATQIGSPLAALGLKASLLGAVPAGSDPAAETAVSGPAYSPTTSGKNMASGGVTPQFNEPITVIDSLGTSHNLTVGFLKTANNTWHIEIYAVPAADVAGGTYPDGILAYGTLAFNGNGSLQSVAMSGLDPTTGAVTANWTNGASASAIKYNFGTPGAGSAGKTDGLSQFDSTYNVNFTNANGAPVGKLTGVSIDQNGFVIATYSNGQTSKLYQIPLAQFSDPNSLASTSGNSFSQTNASGIVNLKQVGSSGVGTISPDSLEASNVELSSQLTNMIVAQRSYEASTKIIQTAAALLNSLDQIVQ